MDNAWMNLKRVITDHSCVMSTGMMMAPISASTSIIMQQIFYIVELLPCGSSCAALWPLSTWPLHCLHGHVLWSRRLRLCSAVPLACSQARPVHELDPYIHACSTLNADYFLKTNNVSAFVDNVRNCTFKLDRRCVQQLSLHHLLESFWFCYKSIDLFFSGTSLQNISLSLECISHCCCESFLSTSELPNSCVGPPGCL